MKTYIPLFAELREQQAWFERMSRRQARVFEGLASSNEHVSVTTLEQVLMSTDHHTPCMLAKDASIYL